MLLPFSSSDRNHFPLSFVRLGLWRNASIFSLVALHAPQSLQQVWPTLIILILTISLSRMPFYKLSWHFVKGIHMVTRAGQLAAIAWLLRVIQQHCIIIYYLMSMRLFLSDFTRIRWLLHVNAIFLLDKFPGWVRFYVIITVFSRRIRLATLFLQSFDLFCSLN